MAWLFLSLHLSHCYHQICPSTLSVPLPNLTFSALFSSVSPGVPLPQSLPVLPCFSGLVCPQPVWECVWLCPPVYLPVVFPVYYWALLPVAFLHACMGIPSACMGIPSVFESVCSLFLSLSASLPDYFTALSVLSVVCPHACLSLFVTVSLNICSSSHLTV